MMQVTEGYNAFYHYCVIRAHFTTKYDYHKYNGKMRKPSDEAFLKRNDRYTFAKLERKYKDKIVDYYVANWVDGNTFIRDMKEDSYRGWQKKMQSLTYMFKQEIGQLKLSDDLLKVKDGQHPDLLVSYMQGDVSLETICILDRLMNFTAYWNKVLDDILFEECYDLINNYKGFVDFPKSKFTGIIKQYLV